MSPGRKGIRGKCCYRAKSAVYVSKKKGTQKYVKSKCFKKGCEDSFSNTNERELLIVTCDPKNLKQLVISRLVLREHSGAVNVLRGQLSRRKLGRSLVESSWVTHVPETRLGHLDRARNSARCASTYEVCIVSSRSAAILDEKCAPFSKNTTSVFFEAKLPNLRSSTRVQEYWKISENDRRFTTRRKYSHDLFSRNMKNSLRFIRELAVPTARCPGIFRSRQNIPRLARLREDPGTLSGFNGQCPSRRKLEGSLLPRSSLETDVQDTQPRNILSAKYQFGHARSLGEHVPSCTDVISSECSTDKLNQHSTLHYQTETMQLVDSKHRELQCSETVYERLRGGGSKMYIVDKTQGPPRRTFNQRAAINEHKSTDHNVRGCNDGRSVAPNEERTKKRVSMESLKKCDHLESQDRTTAERPRVLRFNENCKEMSFDENEDSLRIRGGHGRACKVPQSSFQLNRDIKSVKYRRCDACDPRKQPSAHQLTFHDPPSSCRTLQVSQNHPSTYHLRSPRSRSPASCSYQRSRNHSPEDHPSYESSCSSRPCSAGLCVLPSGPQSCSPPSHYLPLLHPSSSAPPPCSTGSRPMPTHHSFSFHPPRCQIRSRSPDSPFPPSSSSRQNRAMRNQRDDSNSKDCCPCGGCGGAACSESFVDVNPDRNCCAANRQTELPCKCKCQTCESFHPSEGCGGQSCGRIYSCAGSGGGTCCFPRNTKRRSGSQCCGGGNRGCGGCC